jgi:chorismate mutase
VTKDEAVAHLNVHRRRIDEIDVEIVRLLNERTRVVENIGAIKRQATLPIYEPKREELVFDNVTRNNPGPMPPEAVKRVFERIMDEMRTIQRDRMLAENNAGAAAPAQPQQQTKD